MKGVIRCFLDLPLLKFNFSLDGYFYAFIVILDVNGPESHLLTTVSSFIFLRKEDLQGKKAVSYTHLTLPTKA